MARILARFTPERVAALVKMGQFSKPFYTSHVTEVMEARLDEILARYLTKLSPVADVHLDGASRLCGIDLARARRVLHDLGPAKGFRLVGIERPDWPTA
jgi:hypothetical protein